MRLLRIALFLLIGLLANNQIHLYQPDRVVEALLKIVKAVRNGTELAAQQ